MYSNPNPPNLRLLLHKNIAELGAMHQLCALLNPNSVKLDLYLRHGVP